MEEKPGYISNNTIESPSHYTMGGIETIDYIKAKLTKEGFQGYLEGNILKYMSRFKYKNNPSQDLEKAKFHIEMLIKSKGDK